MDINFWAVLVSSVVVMVLGFVWHGPLFGKKFNEAMGMTMPTDPEVRKKMMRGMNKIYLIQFLLFVVQMFVLAKHISLVPSMSAVATAFCLWLGFVMPTVASAAIWNDRSTKARWTIFFVSAGFNLVSLVIAALILGMWN